MFEELDLEEGKRAVTQALRALPACAKLEPALIEALASAAVDLDMQYMRDAGVEGGAEYDEDAAFDRICAGLKNKFPSVKKIDEITEDYMEAWEIYLDSVGAIDWE